MVFIIILLSNIEVLSSNMVTNQPPTKKAKVEFKVPTNEEMLLLQDVERFGNHQLAVSHILNSINDFNFTFSI